MDENYKLFYHLHIAKCGGTYLNSAIINNLHKLFKKYDIEYIDGSQHLGWQKKQNCYIVSSLRDPVKRTVSHYTYGDNYVKNNKKIDIKNFINWVEINKNFISNYQTKNFLYTSHPIESGYFQNIFQPDVNKTFVLIETNKDIALDRIKQVNVLLKDTQLNFNTCYNIANKILKDFNIKDNIAVTEDKKINYNKNKYSTEIYKNLTKKQIEYIYNINSIDSEIYFSDSLYFNDKE